MNILTTNDLKQILLLSITASCNNQEINHIKKYIEGSQKNNINRELSQSEIAGLSVNETVKILMMLFFLTKNVSLEFLRRLEVAYKGKSIIVSQLWENIESIVKKKLILSREVKSYLERNISGYNKIDNFLNAAKTLKFDDLSSEEFVNHKDNSIIRLYLTGKFKSIESTNICQPLKRVEEYTLHDRKTCFHAGLYDPFKFEESQTWVSYRYNNTSPTRTSIDSILTVKFALPELTILNIDNTFIKIPSRDIPNFLEKNIKSKEISSDLYQAIEKDYPKLFFPPLDIKTFKNISKNISQLISQGMNDAEKAKKPLLILVSEVHGSKESFLFHIIILLIAQNFGIKHLLAETINIYHEEHGWDAQVDEIKKLLSFAQEKLGFQVKDLEKELHYQSNLCAYPYHDIPESEFGIEARESSWIIDAKEINDNQIMIVGSGHLNNLLHSPLKDSYHMLPIDCSGDKDFSDMLSISQHNFILLDKSVNHLTLDEIIKMANVAG